MHVLQLIAGIGAGIAIGLVLLARHRVPARGLARPLLGFLVCVALWAFGDTVAATARDMDRKQLGVAIFYTGLIYLPTFWWISSVRWARLRGCDLPFRGRAWARLPLVWATVMWAAMITNPWHGQFLVPVVGGRNLYQPLWWVMAVPNYLLILGAVGVELAVVRQVRLPQVRRQSGFVIAAALLTLTASVLYVSPAPSFNGTLLVLAVSTLLLFVGMVREGAFGVLPVAMRMLAEEDPDGLVIVRLGGRVAYLNPRARDLLGPLGVSLESRIPQALGGEVRHAGGATLESGGPGWETAWWQALMRPEGSLFSVGGDESCWLHMNAGSVRDRRDRLMALCIRLRDVTAERRSEMQVRRADRLESVARLAQGVGHDFRNLLAIVRGNADLLTDEYPEDAALQRKVARIREAGERATELASQLQLYAEGTDPVRARIDLSQLARDLVDLLRPEFHPAAHLELGTAGTPLPVQADATQLRQVLLNLLVNAREALPEEGGAVTAATGSAWVDPARTEHLVVGDEEPPGEYAWVEVADTGVGMDAATRERLFEPYFSTKGKQRGVGLSSALGIVRAHGGLLRLQSAPGRGTSMRLFLPLRREEDAE